MSYYSYMRFSNFSLLSKKLTETLQDGIISQKRKSFASTSALRAKCRDLFESVKKSVLEVISEEKHVPRIAVVNMKDEMQTSLHGLQANPTTEMETVHDNLDQMISDMTGEQLFSWDDHEIDMIMGVEDGIGMGFSGPPDMFDDMLGNVDTRWDNTI
ncbi:hypothetical protein L207DRAFT_527063 [Hyaloscypha variabilis F]|uniref:Uncharacterized protein n=1 Tax=Hyaloscypha variabilis (strain UAMH 11265 / GT02V1 / F) TaxID=1149755 RepID=A0A2J6RUB2_HYAVF|nr:hypothetical protein L207DRAFT_527063 [Hyaloscypha variabilis F]